MHLFDRACCHNRVASSFFGWRNLQKQVSTPSHLQLSQNDWGRPRLYCLGMLKWCVFNSTWVKEWGARFLRWAFFSFFMPHPTASWSALRHHGYGQDVLFPSVWQVSHLSCSFQQHNHPYWFSSDLNCAALYEQANAVISHSSGSYLVTMSLHGPAYAESIEETLNALTATSVTLFICLIVRIPVSLCLSRDYSFCGPTLNKNSFKQVNQQSTHQNSQPSGKKYILYIPFEMGSKFEK